MALPISILFKIYSSGKKRKPRRKQGRHLFVLLKTERKIEKKFCYFEW